MVWRFPTRVAAAVTILAMLAALAAAATAAGGRVNGETLARAITLMTGHKPAASGEARFSLWPALKVTLDGFTLRDLSGGDTGATLLSAARAEFELSRWAALAGRTEITAATFTDPEIAVLNGPDGPTLPVGRGSQLEAAALMRRLLPGGESTAPRGGASGLLPQTTRIINGKLTFTQATGGAPSVVIEAIDVELRLPQGDPSAMLFGTARIDGQPVALRLRTGDLVGLLAGFEASLNGNLTSDIATASMEGRGGFLPQPFFAGRAAFSAPSLAGAARWAGWSAPFTPEDAPVSISGRIGANGARLDMEDLSLSVGGTSGRGALSIVPGPETSSVSGSLDFEELDIETFAQSFLGPNLGGPANGATGGLDLDLDLRLSARSARLGGVQLADVAATTRIAAGMVSLDVNNAAVFGGTAQVAVKADRQASPQQVELRVLAEDVRTSALAPVSAMLAGLLDANADASIILQGPWVSLPGFLMSARGSLKLNTGDGQISGIGLKEIVARLSDGEFGPVTQVAGASLRFREMLAEADIGDGVVQLRKARAGLALGSITLAGSHSIIGGNLALAGTIDLESGHPLAQGEAKSLPFFVGGSLGAPFLSSVAPPAAP
jgi:AsmA protein